MKENFECSRNTGVELLVGYTLIKLIEGEYMYTEGVLATNLVFV